jgi:hypothetical protein
MNLLDTSPDRVRAEQIQRLRIKAAHLAACASTTSPACKIELFPRRANSKMPDPKREEIAWQ